MSCKVKVFMKTQNSTEIVENSVFYSKRPTVEKVISDYLEFSPEVVIVKVEI